MSNILYVAFPYYGHVNPTFGVFVPLRERGHRIKYLTFTDELVAHIRHQGFEADRIPNITFAEGAPSEAPLIARWVNMYRGIRGMAGNMRHLQSAETLNTLDTLIGDFAPDMIMMDNYLSLLAPLMWHHTQKMMLYSCLLPMHKHPSVPPLSSTVVPTNPALVQAEWDKYNKMRKRGGRIPKLLGFDMVKAMRTVGEKYNFPVDKYLEPERQGYPVFALPELIDVPRAFDYPNAVWADNMVEGGPGVYTEIKHDAVAPFERDPDKRLIYCSFGTIFPELQKKKRHAELHAKFCEIARQMSDCQFLVTTGKRPFDSSNAPANVVYRQRVHQLDVLREADVFITHGGLNSTKEAILTGTPMLVCAFAVDWLGNAARVFYHEAGEYTDFPATSADELVAQLRRLLDDERYQNGVNKLRAMFEHSAEVSAGANAIEAVLNETSQLVVTG